MSLSSKNIASMSKICDVYRNPQIGKSTVSKAPTRSVPRITHFHKPTSTTQPRTRYPIATKDTRAVDKFSCLNAQVSSPKAPDLPNGCVTADFRPSVVDSRDRGTPCLPTCYGGPEGFFPGSASTGAVERSFIYDAYRDRICACVGASATTRRARAEAVCPACTEHPNRDR